MGKKGSWFSAIKRVFTHSSKEKPTDGSDKKSSKEKKKGKAVVKQFGETKSFIPLFREPSSIEKILGEADQLLIRPPPNNNTSSSQRPSVNAPPALPLRPISPNRVPSPKSAISPKATSPRVPVSPKATSPKATTSRLKASASASASTAENASSKAPPKVTQSRKEIRKVQWPEPTLRNQQLSATKIQAAYRGYLARRSFRALKGLVRLQGVVRGQNVKRQTMNAMKQMQLLVRVQTQIQSRRIQMLENQRQPYRNDKEVESTLSKWTNQLSEAGQNEDWDDSVLTKEEVDERLRKKVEAVIKRERAMAYAYSSQLWKANPKSIHSPLDTRTNGFPWWWNWLERQLPEATTSHTPPGPKSIISSTPPWPVSGYKPSPRLPASNHNKHNNNNNNNCTFDNHESVTPRSSRSAIPIRVQQLQTPTRTPFSKPRASAASSGFDTPLKDDDSLVSCPPFSVPNYMTPTVSAKAKARANSNPRERFPRTPGSDSNRRFSFPLTPNIGSFKWNKGSSNKDSEKHDSARSIGEFSVDSTVSMPALVGRKPFNRFV